MAAVLGRREVLGPGRGKNETLLFASNKFAQMAWCVRRIDSGIALEKQNLIKQIKLIVQSCPTLLILPSEHGTSSLPFSVNRSGIHQQQCSSVKVRRCALFVMLFWTIQVVQYCMEVSYTDCAAHMTSPCRFGSWHGLNVFIKLPKSQDPIPVPKKGKPKARVAFFFSLMRWTFPLLEKKRGGGHEGHFRLSRIFSQLVGSFSWLFGFWNDGHGSLELLAGNMGLQPKSHNIAASRSETPKEEPITRKAEGSMALTTTWNAWMQKWCRRPEGLPVFLSGRFLWILEVNMGEIILLQVNI